MPVLPLTTLCENVLLQNHLQIRDIGSTRYSLIKRVLLKLTSQQLINLENCNPILLLDDDEIWFNLLKKEFPENLHERYTTNLSKIVEFFKYQLDELNFDYQNVNLENYVRHKEVSGSIKKFKLPSKLLFLKYQQEYIKKEEMAIENLRQRMKSIQESKEKNRVVHLDEVITVDKPRKVIRNKQERSKLFQKSQGEAKRRRELFKNPINMPTRRSIAPPSQSQYVHTPNNVSIGISRSKSEPISTSKVTKPMIRPNSPPKPRQTTSIFHKPKPRRPVSPSKRLEPRRL